MLNAGQAYTISPSNPNAHINPVNTNDNFDGSIGGPIWIPKVYNGKNRSFFFFNWDNFITHNQGSGYTTAPTLAMRNGDFSAVEASAPKSLGTEPDGTPIAQYEIFDPNSNYTYQGPDPAATVSGQHHSDVPHRSGALKVQALIPMPTNTGLVNNLVDRRPPADSRLRSQSQAGPHHRRQDRVSIYWGEWRNWVPKNSADGYPYPLSPARNYISTNHTIRYDLRPDASRPLCCSTSGWANCAMTTSTLRRTPRWTTTPSGSWVWSEATPTRPAFRASPASAPRPAADPTGFGPVNANNYYNDKPTATSQLTWVHGNHTFKFGEEWRRDIWEDINTRGSQGIYNFSAAETGLPYVSSTTLGGGNLGFPYASFLLGQVDNATVSNLQDPQIRKIGLGLLYAGHLESDPQIDPGLWNPLGLGNGVARDSWTYVVVRALGRRIHRPADCSVGPLTRLHLQVRLLSALRIRLRPSAGRRLPVGPQNGDPRRFRRGLRPNRGLQLHHQFAHPGDRV